MTESAVPSRDTWLRVSGVALLALVAVGSAVAAFLAGTFDVSLSTLPYAVVGAALVWRRPRELTGWVLVIFAVLWAATFLGTQVALVATSEQARLWAAWVSEWTWLPALVAVFGVLPIVFPTGRPISPRWRVVLWWVAILSLGFVVFTTIQHQFSPEVGVVVANPWALLPVDDVEAFVGPLALPVVALGPIAAIVRFRRSRGVERQQLRWFMYAAVVCGVVFLLNAALDGLAPGLVPTVKDVIFVTGLSLPPIGIWVAVTRYHLYDIDRVVSRTVSYGLLTAILAGLYVAFVFLLGAVLPVEGDLPVAVSTLIVAALFDPIRRRSQETVDRQFNRSRYDARRLVEGFSRRLRSEGDLVEVETELTRAIAKTMEPASLALWLRDLPVSRPQADMDATGISRS